MLFLKSTFIANEELKSIRIFLLSFMVFEIITFTLINF
jgi:hypothetical protein